MNSRPDSAEILMCSLCSTLIDDPSDHLAWHRANGLHGHSCARLAQWRHENRTGLAARTTAPCNCWAAGPQEARRGECPRSALSNGRNRNRFAWWANMLALPIGVVLLSIAVIILASSPHP